MVQEATIFPAELITSSDSEAMLSLFGEALQLADAAAAGVPRHSIAPPAPFWLLARQDPPLPELLSWWNGIVPQDWPAWFERNRENLSRSPLRESFVHCLENGPKRGVGTGRDLCRLMGAVAQTLYCTNLLVVRRNRELASLRSPLIVEVDEWSDETLFITRRPDERGGYVASGDLSLWMASHVGPRYADKLENQDAVCASKWRDGLVFALADGVSTSLGSRFAAAFAAFWFCREMQTSAPGSRPGSEVLIAAAQRTQQAMDALLNRLLADPGGAHMDEVMRSSCFPNQTAEAVLENTITAEKSFLQPALASTLIAGFLQTGTRQGEFAGAVICIGDGAVERIAKDGTVDRIFSTDPGVTAIDATIGPGPLSRQTLQDITGVPVVLNPGDRFLVSSDGLARGHQGSIWAKIEELDGDVRSRFRSGNTDAAAGLLSDLAAAAENANDTDPLFDDNLSLILLAAD